MLITATFQPLEEKKSSDELLVVIWLTSQVNISNHKGRNHLMIKDIHKTTNLDLNFTKTHKERVILCTSEQMLSVFQAKDYGDPVFNPRFTCSSNILEYFSHQSATMGLINRNNWGQFSVRPQISMSKFNSRSKCKASISPPTKVNPSSSLSKNKQKKKKHKLICNH